MLKNSSYFHYDPCEGSSELLIIFSGAGAKGFNLFKLLKDYPINKLFIRDATRSWYQNPILEHWQDMDGMIAQIKIISENFEGSKITCMGGSMGGYAALVTAAKLNAERALVFSPQTIIDPRLPNQPSPDIKLLYPNAFDVLSKSPETKVKFISGTEDFADIYNISSAYQYRRFEVEFIYMAPHNLMNYLFQRNMLLEVIDAYLQNRPAYILNPVINFLDYPNLLRTCCEFVRALYFDDFDSVIAHSMLNQLQQASPSWPGVYHHRGKLYAKSSHHFEAVIQFEKAASLNAFMDETIFHDLGKSAMQVGDYKMAEYAFENANKFLSKPSPTYLSKLGAAMMLQERYDEAINLQRQACELNNKFGPAYYQLGLLFSKTKRYSESIEMFEKAIAVDFKHPNLKKNLATATNLLNNSF